MADNVGSSMNGVSGLKKDEKDKEMMRKRYPNVEEEGHINSDDSRERALQPKRSDEGKPKEGRRVKQLIQISCDEAGRVNRPIEDEPYYHGFMSRQECEPLLTKDGQFLVRKTEFGGHVHYVLSVFQSKAVHSFLVKRTNKKRLFWVYDYAFKTVSDLIQYHYRNREPISDQGILLLRPCFKQEWQLNHEQVERSLHLGEGAFGEVYKGTLQTSPFLPKVDVAIKTLHSGSMSSDERIKFLREANVMRELTHPNVIKFHGVATAKEPIMIVMELASEGSLVNRLQDIRHPNTPEDKLNYVYGSAKGLEYLEKKQILHRDIAARNCLLGPKDEVKISDFGLSLLGNEYREKKMKNVPIRWLAPETLRKGTYSLKTDVYSFSVLIYEIYSRGTPPYNDVDNHKELRKMIITQKICLRVLGEIPPPMDALRIRCADYDPEKRPTFTDVVNIVQQMEGVRCTNTGGGSIWSKITKIFRPGHGHGEGSAYEEVPQPSQQNDVAQPSVA